MEQSADKVSGAWLFKGTRLPVKALFENLEAGATIDEFLELFPGVTHKQVQAVLEFAEQSRGEKRKASLHPGAWKVADDFDAALPSSF